MGTLDIYDSSFVSLLHRGSYCSMSGVVELLLKRLYCQIGRITAWQQSAIASAKGIEPNYRKVDKGTLLDSSFVRFVRNDFH